MHRFSSRARPLATRWLPAILAAGLLASTGVPAATAQTLGDDALPEKAACREGDVTEDPDLQGRVPQSAYDDPAESQFNCNLDLVGRHGNSGGYKVERYIDAQGQECAFYDTTLLIGVDAVDVDGNTPGTYVLDVSDPTAPVQTATIATPAFASPHESVLLNQERGLIAAVLANPVFFPGQVDIWDVSKDCRNPVFQSSLPLGTLGHESGFSPDGNTYWTASLHSPHVTAIDITNPMIPEQLWVGAYYVHGISFSPDGNQAYFAWRGEESNRDEKGLAIFDVSEIQARVPNPVAKKISYTTWSNVGTPQVNIPVTFGGVPHLVEMDEFGGPANIGAARIINIADPTAPFVVSQMRLEVNQPSNQAALAGDLGMGGAGLQGYRGHYCGVNSATDPTLIGCTFILSGLRLFDVSDFRAPKEVAYFNVVSAENATTAASSRRAPYAMSSVVFDPDNGHVWYSDGTAGFFILDVDDSIYPPGQAEAPTTPVFPATAPAPANSSNAAGAKTTGTSPALPATGGSTPLGAIAGVLALSLAVITTARSRRTASHRRR